MEFMNNWTQGELLQRVYPELARHLHVRFRELAADILTFQQLDYEALVFLLRVPLEVVPVMLSLTPSTVYVILNNRWDQ